MTIKKSPDTNAKHLGNDESSSRSPQKSQKKIIEFLRTKRILTGVPTVVKFRMLDGGKMRSFKAKKGAWVVKWNDLLKAFREFGGLK